MIGAEPYLLSLIAFAVGSLAGFQRVHAGYQRDAASAAATWQGAVYLLSRGAVPAAAFVLIGPWPFATYSWLGALAYGTSVEAILRTRVSYKQTQDAQGSFQEHLKGFLDLLRWYESLLLDNAGIVITGRRKRFILANLPNLEFPALCQRILNNVPALPQQTIRQEIEQAVEQTRAEYLKKLPPPSGSQAESSQVELQYRLMLGFKILDILGRQGFRTICCN